MAPLPALLTMSPCLAMLLSTALGATLPADSSSERNFTGYQVFSMTPSDSSQVSWLLNLQINSSISCSSPTSPGSQESYLDWWSEPGTLNTSAVVSVPPGCLKEVEGLVKEQGIQYNVTIPDLEKLIRDERKYRFLSHFFHWDSQDWSPEIYHNLGEIEGRLDSLLSQYPHLLTRQHLGTTYEGRDISAIVVRQEGPRNKPVIWLDCGIHAREWVSPPACLHAIHSLVTEENSVNPRDNLLSSFDFYILSVANPDGYVFSWESDRMWRKNRHPTSGRQWAGTSECKGVDPNRNFDADFASAPRQKCKESYRGRQAFSEAESQAIKKGINSIKASYGQDRLAAFVSIHAYSQFWMSPMGYTYTRPKDHADHMRVMKVATDALAEEYGTRFKFGPISEIIYRASGSSVDWAYENAGIKYSFGLELRDAGQRGFMLPQREIQPTVKETWAGLAAMARAIQPEFPVKQATGGDLQITFG